MLFEALLRQTYDGKSVLNRWHYSGSGTPAAVSLSFALAKAFGVIPDAGIYPTGSIFRTLAAIQNSGVTYQELQVRALYDVSDFYVVPFPGGVGGQYDGGSPMSPFNAFAVQSNRVRTDVRRGSKRFVGVSEETVGNYGALTSGVLTALGTVATAMSTPLTYDDEGNTLTFQSCVLSFEEYTSPRSKPAYKQYATLALQMEHAALGVLWTAKPNVTTQNSRKA